MILSKESFEKSAEEIHKIWCTWAANMMGTEIISDKRKRS
jgi:hypothetical protein